MDIPVVSSPASPSAPTRTERLSYKFQRLRERIRQAVLSGDLSGKLPGERELARRFKANPKTLSKALTDLAAEGLLDRSIGRGTFVRGAAPEVRQTGRWMVWCPPGQCDSALVRQLRSLHASLEIVPSNTALRPSLLSQFNAVIDLDPQTGSAFRRDLLVRGMTLLIVGSQPAPISAHSVQLDRAGAAHRLARNILLAGHRSILVIEPQDDPTVSTAVRFAVARHSPDTPVDVRTAEDAPALLTNTSSAVLCDGGRRARAVADLMRQFAHLSDRTLAAVGFCEDEPPCTGVFASSADVAGTVVELLREDCARPTTLWLSGTYTDRNTLRAIPERPLEMVEPGQFSAVSA